MSRLAIITTHPIQYNAPLLRLLAAHKKITLKVFYTWSQSVQKVEDKGFGKTIEWDIPLLDGYNYEVVDNLAKKPGNKSFWGIKNPDLIDKIKIFAPNAILIYGWNFQSHFRVMRYFKGKIPMWFRGDSTLLDYKIRTFGQLFQSHNSSVHQFISSSILQFLKFQLRRIVLSYIYQHIDKAFYVGTNNKTYYKAFGLKENQLVFAPHAIENERFRDNPKNKYEEKALEWRQKLGYTEKDIIILFCGKFEPKKNPVFLLKTFIEWQNHRFTGSSIHQFPNSSIPQFINSPIHQFPDSSNFKLLFIGNGPLESQLKKLANKNTSIQFLPFQNQSQMPLVYRLGDIFCLPSQGPNETWGLAVNEAMACERPVLISNKVGCAANLIEHDKNGWIFLFNDKSSLLKIFDTLLDNTSRLKNIGEENLKKIKNWNYKKTVDIMTNELLKLIK